MTKYLIAILVIALLAGLCQLKIAMDKHKEEIKNKEELDAKKIEKKKELLDRLADLKSQAMFNDLWFKDKLINEYSYEVHKSQINKEIDEIEKEINKCLCD